MNHSIRFPIKPQDKRVWFAHNPEDENDARTFRDEAQAFDHFCDYGRYYRYTVINETERTCKLLDEDFAERQNDTKWEREASAADRAHQLRMEGAW